MDLVMKFYEQMWNLWDFDATDELLAEDFDFRGSLGREVRGREAFRGYMRLVKEAFSNFHNRVQHLIDAGPEIVARVEYTGVHDGSLFGIAPTHRAIRYSGLAIFRTDGKHLLGAFVVGDTLALFQQVLGERFWVASMPGPKDGETPPPEVGVASDTDGAWCAELMAHSEPWITLRRDLESAALVLQDPQKELYVARQGERRLGFVLIDMHGPFAGYVQTLCVAPECRDQGVGAVLLKFAEDRIFRELPNVFLCVSSFNPGARRFYARHNYESVGNLPDLIIAGASEIILRKTAGPRATWRPAPERPGSLGLSPQPKGVPQ